MKLSLAENIRKFRKERNLTQEQLAEILGLTTGAVHKWESGQSVPELNLIVEMADFFDVSVDVLLGYQLKDNQISSIISRLQGYCRTLDPEALTEAEKALKKYPNSFEIVYNCASVYLVFGIDGRHKDILRRALELLEKARLLLPQNTNPEVDDQMIFGDIASVRFLLGEQEKSLELMKKHNACGVFNDFIGVILSIYLRRYEEAETYLSNALLQNTNGLFNAAVGYAFVFFSHGDYASAESILTLMVGLLLGLKKKSVPDFIDKAYAELLVLLAYSQYKGGKNEAWQGNLKKAAETVSLFDASPDYGIENFRYASVTENMSIHDILGTTARESVDSILSAIKDPAFEVIWKEVSDHE